MIVITDVKVQQVPDRPVYEIQRFNGRLRPLDMIEPGLRFDIETVEPKRFVRLDDGVRTEIGVCCTREVREALGMMFEAWNELQDRTEQTRMRACKAEERATKAEAALNMPLHALIVMRFSKAIARLRKLSLRELLRQGN